MYLTYNNPANCGHLHQNYCELIRVYNTSQKQRDSDGKSWSWYLYRANDCRMLITCSVKEKRSKRYLLINPDKICNIAFGDKTNDGKPNGIFHMWNLKKLWRLTKICTVCT